MFSKIPMKNLSITILVFFAALNASAKNYYVAANGSDANNGISLSTPWKTISKVNSSFSIIAAGDSILFRRGDVFYGALVIAKSGASGRPIVISAYGTGAKPVFSGFTTLSSWSNAGNGIYQAYLPAAKSTLNLVTINNQPQALGRYPNVTEANGGYLTYESFSGSTSITDNELTGSTNWTGAEVVIRKRLWILDRCKVTAQSGGTLTFTNTNGSTYDGMAGYGYFFQNDPRTLDQFGEWYYKSSNSYLQIYFGTANPSSYTIKAGTIDTLVVLSSKSYININNIAFEGANGNAISAISGGNINIQNCDFTNAGISAVNTQQTSNLLVENCTTNNMLSNAIYLIGSQASGVTVRGCNVKNTATLKGMGLSNGSSYKGIFVTVAGNVLIEYNNVDTTGYVGIEFQGNNVNVRYNVVNYFAFVKDDGGGIYTYASGTDAAPGPTYTNRVVNNNIIMNGIGAPEGRSTPTRYVTGIYMDGRTMNVNVLNNTVFNNAYRGIHCNNPNNVVIRGNTSFNDQNSMSVARWSWGSISNFSVKNNIFYPKTNAQRCFYYVNSGLNDPVANTVQNALMQVGSVDSNTYSSVNPAGFNPEIYATSGGALVPASQMSLEAWRSFASHDQQSKKAKMPIEYKLNGLVGSNKFSNGLFNTGVTGITLYGTNILSSWDNTGKINGGALKITFSAPAPNKYALIYSSVGAVSSSKKYIFRFSTYGTTQQGIVRAYIRKSASPYTSLTPTQVRTFGTGRTDHEFLFSAPASETNASFLIELEQNSGTTYIDNIEFYEANATLYDAESQLRFEYNATKTARTIPLDTKYTGADGTAYSTSLTLQPFTSIILIKDTGATSTAPTPPPANTTLQATGSAATVNCFGGNTTVNVTAAGGTAPYTGTGSFTANAGKGSLKMSFPTSKPDNYTLMYYTIGAVSSSKTYTLKFTTLGTTSSGNLKAAIRQTNTPWATITSQQYSTYGTARKEHTFIFKAPPSEAAASLMIGIEQSSGTTYIDNVAFFESDTAGVLKGNNLYSSGQFEDATSPMFFYASNNNYTVTWDKTNKIGSIYYYTVKDAANNTSVAAVTISQPSALSVAATAGIITSAGGSTTVTVTASGGTAPYTGTGSFTITAGTYTYTVTDAKGCTASKTITVQLSQARLANETATVTNGDTASAAETVANTLQAERVITGKQLQLTAYPNPSANTFNLLVEGGNAGKITINVYSFDGKLIYQTAGNSNTRYSFGNNFMPGMYVVKVLQGSETKTLRIVKGNN